MQGLRRLATPERSISSGHSGSKSSVRVKVSGT